MNTLLATQQGGIILKPFASILGKILEAIYFCFSSIGIENIALCIIIFTVVVRVLMLPMTIKQQKFSKLNAVMNPEIQAIQKKYKNKKDQASQMAMQEEISSVYDKYGVSPTGSCLQLIIQLPIMFALYRVIMNIPAYIGSVKEYYLTILNNMSGSQIKEFFDINVASVSELTTKEVNTCIDAMSGYSRSNIRDLDLGAIVNSIDNTVVTEAYEHINSINSFFCYDLNLSPAAMKDELNIFFILLIPILAAVTQFISVQLTTKLNGNSGNMDDNPMASSMKTMNYIMPFMSAYMCYILATGIGIYWVTGSAVVSILQIIINIYLSKMDVNKIIEQNKEKAEIKKAKRKEREGIYREQVMKAAATNTKNISKNEKDGVTFAEKERMLEEAKKKNATSKTGSMAAKVNMVSEYNKKNNK